MSYKSELYQQVIIEHNKNPRNFRKIENATHMCPGHNPLCGDSIVVYLDVKDGVIQDASFEGVGCAISKSSSSLMTEFLKGKTTSDVRQRFQEFTAMVTGELDPEKDPHELKKLTLFEGVKEYSARVKCATLAWHAMIGALDKEEKASTE